MPVNSIHASRPASSRNAGPSKIAQSPARGRISIWPLLVVVCLAGGQRTTRTEASESVPTQATLRSGESFDATLTEVTDQKEFVFDAQAGRRAVSIDDLVVWGSYTDRSQGTHIVLIDGSVLVADVLGIEQDAIVVIGRLWQEARLPRQAVRALIFHPPVDTFQRDALLWRALAGNRQESRLLLENGDELTGRLPDAVAREAGAFQLTRISWNGDAGDSSVDVALDRIVAVLLDVGAPAAPLTRENRVVVGLRDGSLIRAHTLHSRERNLQFQLAAGPHIINLTTDASLLPTGDPWNAVVMLQPLQTQIIYVSDLEILGYKHIPYLDRSWSYQLDRSVGGGRLRYAGHVWSKGLGMHSSSRLAVETYGQYQELQAELAIDQTADQQGSVIFRVYIQETAGTWKLAYESGTVRGGDPLVPLRVDVRSAVRLALIVDFADRADQWDHANWLNARLVGKANDE
ncbi:MAG: NPCBM/NEW2 domain-containing protein [Pirellulaceae bacterium]